MRSFIAALMCYFMWHIHPGPLRQHRGGKPNLSLCQNGAVVLVRCQTHPHAALILIQGTEGEILHVICDKSQS